MVDYYSILKVKRTASAAEVKSAYRKLARERHPDVNGGTEKAAREFALISLAYRTLSDPQERAYYDNQLKQVHAHTNDFVVGSVFNTENRHAQRLRRTIIQARFDRRVDQLIEADRRENFVMQQAVFTTVTLFLSTFFVAWFKPALWDRFQIAGRAVVFTLFVIGLWHLAVRLKACFEHYTYKPKSIHDSLINADKPDKPFTRFTASTFLILGYAASLASGLYLGSVMKYVVIFNDLPGLFGQGFRFDLLFYPPIAVLIVDTMHTVAAKID